MKSNTGMGAGWKESLQVYTFTPSSSRQDRQKVLSPLQGGFSHLSLLELINNLWKCSLIVTAFRRALAVILHLHWQSISLKIDYVKEQGGAISHPFAAPIAPCSPPPCTQAKCCAHSKKKKKVPHAENCGRVCRSSEEFRKSKNEKSFLTFSYDSLFIVGCALISISVIRQLSKGINQPFKRHCCHFISFLHPASVTMDAFLQPSDRFDCYKYQAYVIWEEWCALTSVKGR